MPADPSDRPGNTSRMLEELRVENLLLLDRAALRLGAGLNVLTGETGAGKTLLAQALDLLLGGRARGGVGRGGGPGGYGGGGFSLDPAPAGVRGHPRRGGGGGVARGGGGGRGRP